MRRIRRQVNDIESAEQWLKQVARSKCKVFLVDAKKRGIVREYAEEYYAFAAAREESRCYLPEHLDEVLKIVEEMGSIYIEVVELWAQGFTENESAAILNISPNTVKSRRNKIRKVVRERVGVSHP